MRRPPSLALRLNLLFGIAVLVVFSAFGWLIQNSIQRHFAETDTSELEIIAQAVGNVLSTRPARENSTLIERRFDDLLVGHHSTSLLIKDRNGETVFTSQGPDLSAVIQENSHGSSVQEWNDGKHNYRVLVRPVRDKQTASEKLYTMAVAVPIDYHLRFLHGFRNTLWLMIASGIAITSLLGWLAIRQGLAPLHNIVNRIRHISANELNTRLKPEKLPGELTDLAVSFNGMLGRMEESFQRLSNFSADIAHDLRTPMTTMMTQTQVALSQTRTVDEYREILYSNIEEYEQMAQMITDMLFLAQADNGQHKLNATDIDLAREVTTLFEYYDAWAEERGISLALEGNALVSGDRLMLRRALGNLLSNSIRHASSGEPVRVKLSSSEKESVDIVIENPGPEIPAEHIPKLFDRFYRVDPSRQEGGTGLGLAIVKSIVDVHGGKVSATSTETLTKFKITLPAEQIPGICSQMRQHKPRPER